jgi:hypothetical protein
VTEPGRSQFPGQPREILSQKNEGKRKSYINQTMSIMALNVKGLNNLIKRQTLGLGAQLS